MATTTNVNSKIVIKIPPPKYFHCFKLNQSNYALFDIKMDMPLVIGSLAIIKSSQLPPNSTVFYYEIGIGRFFKKRPEKTIEISGEGKHQKAPLRYHYVDKNETTYHNFKISPVIFSLWDSNFKMPIVYGSNQKVQAVLNQIAKNSTVFYYQEDLTVKNSFKLFVTFEGK